MMKKELKAGSSLYFIGIVPKRETLSAMSEMKKVACERYHSCASLNAPPHITLHMPFQWKDKKKKKLLDCLADIGSKCGSFSLNVEGVGSFGERVIYLSIKPSEELKALQASIESHVRRELNLFNALYKDRPFYPHITLAFRDLRKKHFQDAFQYFKGLNYQCEFVVEDFALLKYVESQWRNDQLYLL